MRMLAADGVIEASRPGQESESATTGLPVLDLVHLGRYTMGDDDFQREILGLFREQIGNSLAQLRAAECEGDVAAWRMGMHTLKGASRAVGAFHLGKSAELAERAVESDEGRREALRRVAAAAAITINELP